MLKQKTNIKLLILDVDGVMTDGGMYYTESGEELKRFDAKDGRGIIELQKKGVLVGIISSGFKSTIVKNRAQTLGIKHVYVGTKDKLTVLLRWSKELGITPSETAFIGDDINDLSIIKEVGLSACPNNAVLKVKNAVTHILKKEGGKGCIREFIDEYLLL